MTKLRDFYGSNFILELNYFSRSFPESKVKANFFADFWRKPDFEKVRFYLCSYEIHSFKYSKVI